MSVSDPDRPPDRKLTREECIKELVSTGWHPDAAAGEWERLDKTVAGGVPVVDVRDLTW